MTKKIIDQFSLGLRRVESSRVEHRDEMQVFLFGAMKFCGIEFGQLAVERGDASEGGENSCPKDVLFASRAHMTQVIRDLHFNGPFSPSPPASLLLGKKPISVDMFSLRPFDF